jgi:hypothetical protein
MKQQVEDAVRELSRADTSTLYEKLGAYASAFPRDPSQFTSPQTAVAANVAFAGPLDEAAELGKRILRRWNKAIYDLVCTGDGVDLEARKTIFDALKINSPEALAAAITGVLISVFSVGPAIAAVVGVLFGKVLLPAAGQEACSFWKERL